MVNDAYAVKESPSARQPHVLPYIYPVQIGNQLILHLPVVTGHPADVAICSGTGRKTVSFSAVSDKKVMLKRSNFPPGVYLVKVECNGKKIFSRFAVL